MLCLLLLSCAREAPPDNSLATYFDHTGRDDVLAGGVRMIPIETPKGSFRVWTKRIGNNPGIKVLMLHGGAGATHEYFEAFDSYKVPTLVIGARHDTMDPKHMEWMAKQFPNGSYLYCPNGSHLAIYDDQATYFKGLIEFLKKADSTG